MARNHAQAARTPARLLLPALLIVSLLALTGCNYHYGRGLALEGQERWEEASIEYHLAVLKDPDVPEYTEALERAERVVARENMELYHEYLAQKQFRKSYNRLQDATRQDPELSEARTESAKWLRVLVAGQIEFEFESLKANLSLADQIRLMVRLNTPNPGEVIESEIDLETGTFFVENLLYDRPNQMLTYYSLNSIGVALVYGHSRTRKFTSREFQRFVNFRTPVLDNIEGELDFSRGLQLMRVGEHGGRSSDGVGQELDRNPRSNPHYSIKITGQRILVSGTKGKSHFTPRFLYLNRRDRRLFVDFGRYQIRQDTKTKRWGLRRLTLSKEDYFPIFSQNIALQPYFFYREGVFNYEPGGAG